MLSLGVLGPLSLVVYACAYIYVCCVDQCYLVVVVGCLSSKKALNLSWHTPNWLCISIRKFVWLGGARTARRSKKKKHACMVWPLQCNPARMGMTLDEQVWIDLSTTYERKFARQRRSRPGIPRHIQPNRKWAKDKATHTHTQRHLIPSDRNEG